MKPKHQRINNLNFGLMIVVALIFDLISIVPLVNIVSETIAITTFGLWFYFLGVGFINPKRVAIAIAAIVIGFTPILSILPELTLAVVITVIMVKSEDKLGIKMPVFGK